MNHAKNMMRFLLLLVPALACAQTPNFWTQLGTTAATPTGRVFETHDIHAAKNLGQVVNGQPTIMFSSRSSVSGSPVGLFYIDSPYSTWKTFDASQPYSSWTQNCAGEIVSTVLTGTGVLIVFPGNNPATPHKSATLLNGTYGTVRVHDCSSNNGAGTIYVHTAAGYMYISTDGGYTISLMASQHPNAGSGIWPNGALGIRPSDGALFVCGEANPCYMYDGSKWTAIGTANNAAWISFAPDSYSGALIGGNGNRVIVGPSNNQCTLVWDGNVTWNSSCATPSFTFRNHACAAIAGALHCVGRDASDAGTPAPLAFGCSGPGATNCSQESSGLNVITGGGADANGVDTTCEGRLVFGTDESSSNPGAGIYQSIVLDSSKSCGSAPPPPPPGPAILTATLAPSSAEIDTASTLTLAFDPGTQQVAAFQFTLTAPASAALGAVTPGAIEAAANKSLNCNPSATSVTCLVASLKPNLVGAGAVATLPVTGLAAGNIALALTALAADPAAKPISVNTTGATLTVAPSLTLACPSANGKVGAAYSSSLLAGGGFPAYTYSIGAGTLPSGLALNAATGLVSGSPASAGSFSFTAWVGDSMGGSQSVSCSIAIVAPSIADLNGDGVVDNADFALLADQVTGKTPCGTANFKNDGCTAVDAVVFSNAYLAAGGQ